MARYDRLIFREPNPKGVRGPGPTVVRLDDTIQKGSHFSGL
jgi:hypothetical protein